MSSGCLCRKHLPSNLPSAWSSTGTLRYGEKPKEAPKRKSIKKTYAHTCVPRSGMMVNRMSFSLSWTHATGPSDASDAVSSFSLAHCRVSESLSTCSHVACLRAATMFICLLNSQRAGGGIKDQRNNEYL